MWAQLITMRVKPGREQDVPGLFEQLQSAFTGWIEDGVGDVSEGSRLEHWWAFGILHQDCS